MSTFEASAFELPQYSDFFCKFPRCSTRYQLLDEVSLECEPPYYENEYTFPHIIDPVTKAHLQAKTTGNVLLTDINETLEQSVSYYTPMDCSWRWCRRHRYIAPRKYTFEGELTGVRVKNNAEILNHPDNIGKHFVVGILQSKKYKISYGSYGFSTNYSSDYATDVLALEVVTVTKEGVKKLEPIALDYV